QPAGHDRLAQRRVLEDLGREADVGERIAAGRREADVRGGDRPGDVVDRDPAVEGDPVAEPEAYGLLAPGRLGVAPAVDVEADVQGRTGGAQPGDRAEDSVDLVDRCQ